MLIGAGHKRREVWGYTMDEVRAWSDAIDRDRRRRELTLAVIIRAAHHYEPDDFAEFLKD
jgi:hypothetical protein